MGKTLTKNGLFYLVYQVLNVVFPFATGIYVSRVLLINDIGSIAYAQNIASYFVVFSFLGIPTYGMREISKYRYDKEKVGKIFSELFIINLISTAVFSLIYLALILSVDEFRSNMVLYLITGLSIALNAINISWLYEGLEEYVFISLRNILFKTVSFILLILLVRSKENYIYYALITVIGNSGNHVMNMVFHQRLTKFRFAKLDFKPHMKPIFYLVAVNLAIEIYTLVDVTMLGSLTDKATVTIYSYGSKIHKILLQIITSFTIVIVPRITYYYGQKQYEEMSKVLYKALKVIIVLALPLIAGIYVTADKIFVLLYGDDYIGSAYVLKILCIGLLISPAGYLLGSRILLIIGNEKKMMFVVMAGAITNVILNYVLIPVYGASGAAFTSLISESIVAVIYVIAGRKHYLHQIIYYDVLKVVASTLIMFFCIRHVVIDNLYIQVIVQILIAALVYFSILIITREDIVYSCIKRFYAWIGGKHDE